MQDFPLTIAMILRHGRTVHGDSEVVTFEGESSRRGSFVEVAGRAEQLAAALQRLGIEPGDRVGTFQWNTQEHLEAYLAVPTMGAVLHTLNPRLSPDELSFIVSDAEDKAKYVRVVKALDAIRDSSSGWTIGMMTEKLASGGTEPSPPGATPAPGG